MKARELKIKLLDRIKEIKLEAIQTAKERMNDSATSAGEYGPPKDRYDPYRAHMSLQYEMMAKQIQAIQQELSILHKINPESSLSEIGLGSLVLTDEGNYFISVSAGKIFINEEQWLAISPQVPIFALMKGKKKGESFVFNGKTFLIQDIY